MATETDVRPMDDKQRNILRRCKGTLVKDMEPDEVLLQMADSLLFTTEDENKIKSRVTRQQQCETLLEILQRKGAKAYEIFKKTLENVHPHLARTIVEAENKELNYELRLERENSADLRRRLAYTKVKRGTPRDDELEKLGMDIGDIWIKLGRRLDVTDAKQKEIDRAHELLSEKAYYTLKHWKQSKGAAASYQALCDALQDECVQRQDLVEKYCYIKGIDTRTRPMGRVEPSGPIQAEQVSFTVMDTGSRPIQAENLETLDSQILDAVKQLQVAEADCKDVQNRLKEKQEELKDVERKCKDVENRFKEKQEELKDVEGKCKDVENRLKEKQEKLKDVEGKCKDVENRFKEKQEALNKSRHNCGKKSKYTKKTKKNTRSAVKIKVTTSGVTTKQNEQEQNSLLERITSFATLGLKLFPLSEDESLERFCYYLANTLNIHLTGKQAGSLILTVHCRTLEILEQLWQDYSSGHLDSVVEECFLADETTKTNGQRGKKSEAHVDTIGLETTISKKEYLRCKNFLTEISGLESLTDDESVAMENIKYKNILLKFYVLLLEKLDPNEVSVQLLTAGVLTSDDKEKVEEKSSQREKSEELLMILATKGPRAYEEFVKALEKNHCFLACQLLKEEKENLLYEVREREWLMNETMSDLLIEEERAMTAASENEMLKAQLEKEKNPAPQKKAVTLVEIARMMEDLESSWKQLATALELGEANLRKIRKENKTDREKAYAVLAMWTDKEGEDATVERLIDTLEKIAKSRPVEKMLGSEEIVDEEVEVNRLLKKTKDEISVENRKKEASSESSAEAVLKELGIQLPEEQDEDEQKEVAKLLNEISGENRKKEGRKDTSLEAASVKELNIQPQEASSQEGKKPKRKGSKKKAMAS